MPKEAKKAAKPRSTFVPAPPPAHWGGTPDVEKLDTTPVELPAGATIPIPLSQQIANAVHAELSVQSREGFDTPEEAEDFEEEDPEALDMSPYEKYFHDIQEEYPEDSAEDQPEAVSEPPGEPKEEESRPEDSGS